MKYIKFLGVWVLTVVASILIPVMTVFGYDFVLEFTLRETRWKAYFIRWRENISAKYYRS